MIRPQTPDGPPNLRDIRSSDLADTDRLLDLHRQACEAGLASPSEAGRLAFLSLAERARCRGSKPGAMFYWLLRERKTEFITLSDEDEAARRLREHYDKPVLMPERPEPRGAPPAPGDEFDDQDRFVSAVFRVAQANRIDDPYRVARLKREISRDEWDALQDAFQQRQRQRWQPDESSPRLI